MIGVRSWQTCLDLGRKAPGKCQRRNTSLIFTPARLRPALALSRRPLARRCRLPVMRPAAVVRPPLAAWDLRAILLGLLIELPFADQSAGADASACTSAADVSVMALCAGRIAAGGLATSWDGAADGLKSRCQLRPLPLS